MTVGYPLLPRTKPLTKGGKPPTITRPTTIVSSCLAWSVMVGEMVSHRAAPQGQRHNGTSLTATLPFAAGLFFRANQ